MICRSHLRSKLLCICSKGLQQRVYVLYMNNGFIFFRPSLSRANVIMYLFQSHLNNIYPCRITSMLFNRSFFKIESVIVKHNSHSRVYCKAALTSCPINSSYHLGSSFIYSHQVLFTLSYLLVSMSPILGCPSLEEAKVLSPSHRFRNEIAFLLC
jgi:hypothetical protein